MLTVKAAGLEQSAAQLRAALASIGTELETLESRSRLLSANWSGQAREAYLDSYIQWRNQYQQITALLESVIEAITAANSQYGTTERAIKDQWSL